MKHILTADWHLGLNELHDADIEAGCREIAEVMRKQNIPGLIIAGDIFDKPRPTPALNKRFGDCLGIIGAEKQLIISGNHDVTSNYSTVDTFTSEFLSVKDARFVNEVVKMNLDEDTKAIVAPFMAHEDFGQYVGDYMSKHKVDILVTHTDVPGATFGAEREIQLGDVGSLTVIPRENVRLIITGHIHKHQAGTLGGVPYVYPGALARVSHSEEKDAKGFIILETKDMSWEFIKRTTAKKWITVDIDWKGKLPAIQKKGDVIRVNLKAAAKYRGSINRLAIERKLAEQFEHVKLNVEYARKQSKEAEQIAQGVSFEVFEDKWIELNAKGNKTAVCKMIKQTLSQVEEEHPTNKEFFGLTLKELELQNFQSIGKAHKKFKPTDCIGILGEYNGKLTQSNGTGKSSLVEGIRWILYGSTRFSKNASAIRDSAERAEGKIVLETVKKNQVTIERTQGTKAGGCFVHNGTGAHLAKGKEVAEWIESNCGLNLKTFDAIIYMGQDRHSIVGAKPSDRLRTLQEPLPLERYTKGCLNEIKARRSENKGQCEQFRGIVAEYKSNLANESYIEKLKERSGSLAKELADYKAEEKELKTQVKTLTKKEQVAWKMVELQESLDSVVFDLEDVRGKLEKLPQISGTKAALKQKVSMMENKRTRLRDKYADAKAGLATIETQMNELGEEIEFLDTNKDECPVFGGKCVKPNFEEDMFKHISGKELKLKALDVKWQSGLKNLEHLEKDGKQCAQDLKQLQEDYDLAVETEAKRDGLKKTISRFRSDKSKLEQKIKEATQGKKLDSHKDIQKARLQAESKLQRLDQDIEECSGEFNDIKQDLAVYEQSQARLAVAEQKLKKAEKEQEILNICYEAFSPRGIPQFIVMSIIEEINNAIPGIINEFGFWQDVDVYLEPDDSKAASTIAVWARIGDKQEREFEGLSAGEREIVNFIVRMAFKRVLENLIDINYSFVIIDEALDVLDESNFKAAMNFFKKSKMQSFCISHSDSKDQFTKTVVVRNENGIAEVL